MSCHICLNDHPVPQENSFRRTHFTNPAECGLNNVSGACSSLTECAKAIAGVSFENLRFDFDSAKVYAKINGKEIFLLTSSGYDKERELTIREIQVLVINQLKLLVGTVS